MNLLIDPDTHIRPQPAAPADTTAADGGWADIATGAPDSKRIETYHSADTSQTSIEGGWR